MIHLYPKEVKEFITKAGFEVIQGRHFCLACLPPAGKTITFSKGENMAAPPQRTDPPPRKSNNPFPPPYPKKAKAPRIPEDIFLALANGSIAIRAGSIKSIRVKKHVDPSVQPFPPSYVVEALAQVGNKAVFYNLTDPMPLSDAEAVHDMALSHLGYIRLSLAERSENETS